MADLDTLIVPGLPTDWQEELIPTSDDYFKRTQKKLAELEAQLAASDPLPSDQLLSDVHETTCVVSMFPATIETLVEFVIRVRPFIKRAGRNDIWHVLLTNLFASVMDHIKEDGRLSQVLSRLAADIGRMEVLTSGTPEEIFKNAIGFGLDSGNPEEWLLASIYYLEYESLSQPLRDTQHQAANLLEFAKRCDDQVSEMMIYLNLAYAAFRHGDYGLCFTYAQQAFVMAVSLENQLRHALLALSLMMSIRQYNAHLLPYMNQLIQFWWKYEKHVELDLYLRAHFYGHLGGLLYSDQQYEYAARYLRASADLFQRMGDRRNAGLMWQAVGLALTRLEAYVEAEKALEVALIQHDAAANPIDQIRGLHVLGWSIAKGGNVQRGAHILSSALQMARLLPHSQFREQLIMEIEADLASARSAV